MKRAAAWLLVALSGCASGFSQAGLPGRGTFPAANTPRTATPIKHVVVIVQENRTVDNLFQGFPGADTQAWGYAGKRRVQLKEIPLDTGDIDNSYAASIQSYDGGKMDGFYKNHLYASGYTPYSYVNRKQVAPYWTMAEQYTLADHMFPTELGQSYTAHLTLIAGTDNLSPNRAVVDFPSQAPWDCFAPRGTVTPVLVLKRGSIAYEAQGGPYPCFTQFRTMADTLDAAHVSWRFYADSIKHDWIAGAWSAFSSIERVRYGADWKKVVTPPPAILRDVAAGRLAGVSWVTPAWDYSDHAGCGCLAGPSWVAAVVNAIGTSRFWKSTAIIVVSDDFGGWYDHVPPPQLDFRGLGIRVPALIISPYVHRGAVDHTQYEFGSILRFVEQVFALPALGSTSGGYTDTRAASLIDAFDFTQPPLAFHRIPAPYPPSNFPTPSPYAESSGHPRRE
jgi:phospholipase C